MSQVGSQAELGSGRLELRQVAAEQFALEPGGAPYDLAVAVRVGSLDGRHPEAGRRARRQTRAALTPQARLFIDGGDPRRQVSLAD